MQIRRLIGTHRQRNGVVLSRTVMYAVQATIAIANYKSGTPVSAKHLAKTACLPERFLPQILRKLVNKGLLHSSMGVAGGYALSRSPAKITLWDIVDAIEDRKELDQFAVPGLTDAACERLRHSLSSTANAVRESLRMLTLAELIDGAPSCDRRSAESEMAIVAN